jgi:hypothetical protein
MLAFSLVGLGNGLHKDYEAPTPVLHPQTFHALPSSLTQSDKFWCWINPRYGLERSAGEYLWLWFALFASGDSVQSALFLGKGPFVD